MKGTGTQRIEDEISEIFPKARILRMDADTTAAKNAFESKFKAFAAGEYDIIVGTQMIAKGLDFPNVTLVGVLKTDNSLYAGDFRAYERTFSLITQVVGRGGRGGKRGRALIQTFTPDHYVLNLAAGQNYPDFYKEEIELREAMLYPPFCDIIVVGFTSLIDKECNVAALKFRDMLEKRVHGYSAAGAGAGEVRNKQGERAVPVAADSEMPQFAAAPGAYGAYTERSRRRQGVRESYIFRGHER